MLCFVVVVVVQINLVVRCGAGLTIWVDASSLRLGVVASVGSLNLVGIVDVGVPDGGAGLVAWTDVVGWGSKTTGGSGAHLGIPGDHGVVLALLLPECVVTLAGARSVVVGWRWSVALLLLVRTDQENLEDGCDEEKECANNGACECSLVETAGSSSGYSVSSLSTEAAGGSKSERGVEVVVAARASRAARQDGNRDEGSDKSNVNDNCDEAEE